MLDDFKTPAQIRPNSGGIPAEMRPVIGYWGQLREGRPVPSRAELDPSALQPHLSRSGIIERTGTGAVKLRVAGSQLEAIMGMGLRGMPLRAMFSVSDRGRLADLLDQMFAGPLLMTFTLSAMRDGAELGTAHMALMPLTDQRGAVTRALMVLSSRMETGCAPCRFRIRQAHLRPLASPAAAAARPKTRARLRVIDGGLCRT